MALTAAEAARRLNRTERTVRRWIATGELQAFHPTHGNKDKWLIEESEVERLSQELAKEQPGHKQGPAKEDIASLTKEIEKLRREIVDVKTDVKALEQLYYKLQGQTPEPDIDALILPLLKQSEAIKESPHIKRGRPVSSSPLGNVRAVEPPKEIPQASVPYAVFAELHGVNERTARGQIDKGYIPAFVRARPSNPRFKERWLTPSYQNAAIQFWKAHETSGFRTCPECPHDAVPYVEGWS